MSNGKNEPYKVTYGEWSAVESTLKVVHEKLGSLEKTDRSINDTLAGINTALNNMPCNVQESRITRLENRPSAIKAIAIVGGVISLLIAALTIVSLIQK